MFWNTQLLPAIVASPRTHSYEHMKSSTTTMYSNKKGKQDYRGPCPVLADSIKQFNSLRGRNPLAMGVTDSAGAVPLWHNHTLAINSRLSRGCMSNKDAGNAPLKRRRRCFRNRLHVCWFFQGGRLVESRIMESHAGMGNARTPMVRHTRSGVKA